MGTAYSAKTEASEISPDVGSVSCIVSLYDISYGRRSRGSGMAVESPRGGQGTRTDSSGLNHVADGETLDSLVLGNAASAVGAAHGLNVAAAVLVATAIKSISYCFPGLANRLNPVSHSLRPTMCLRRGLRFWNMCRVRICRHCGDIEWDTASPI